MTNLITEIKKSFESSNAFIKLLYANISFFIIYTILWVPYPEIEKTITYLAFPSNSGVLIQKPWTFISYMFVHTDLLHLISNMLFLYFGSKLFLQKFSDKQLIITYTLGGICGAILFTLLFNLFPEHPNFDTEKALIGSSAGVFAIMIASATYKPNHLIYIPIIGSIKLKYIAWSAILLFYIGIGNPNNAGGNLAHIGGAIFGYLYMKKLTRQKYFSTARFSYFEKIIKLFTKSVKIKKTHKRTKSDYQFNAEKAEKQNEIDKILEKISKSGYESLDKKEKENLFSQSKK